MNDHIKIRAALELCESDYPPAIYFPREDIAMECLDKSDKTTV